MRSRSVLRTHFCACDPVLRALPVGFIPSSRATDTVWGAAVLAMAFAIINVTAMALAESGVGFLVADTSLWRLGGDTAVAYAEQAENAWKFMAKQELNQHKVVKSCWTLAFLQP